MPRSKAGADRDTPPPAFGGAAQSRNSLNFDLQVIRCANDLFPFEKISLWKFSLVRLKLPPPYDVTTARKGSLPEGAPAVRRVEEYLGAQRRLGA